MIRAAFVAAGLVAAVSARRAADPWPGATSVGAAALFVAVVAVVVSLDRVLVAGGFPGVAAPGALRRVHAALPASPASLSSVRDTRTRGVAVALTWGVLAAAAMSVAPMLEQLREPGGSLSAEDLPRWALVVTAVAVAQEMLIRGRLWDAVADVAGPRAALVVTTLAFAAIHVPFYGVSVLGVDLAAGLVFGGLRLATGGLLAPVTAHVGADLAGWWIA